MVKRKLPRRTTVQTGLRLPPELIAEVDAFARKLATRTDLPVSRTQAMAWLLRRALDTEKGKP